MAEGTAKQASEPGWLARAVQWRWIKVVVAFVLAAIAGGIGWLLRPSAQEAARVVGPAIGIVANHGNVEASVAMVLTVGNRASSQASILRLTITPTQASRPVTFTVTLSNFPRGTTGSPRPLPLHEPLATPAAIASFAPTALVQPRAGPRYADYYLRQTFLRGSGTPGPIMIISTGRLGEDEAGTQLRVAIPKIVGEVPGTSIPASETGQRFYAGARNAPGFSQPAVVPTLLPGLSTFVVRSSSVPPLADFQVLSGDPPTTLLGSEWAWNGINGATVLAANVAAQDDAQIRLFWAGLALGLAGGAVVTGVIELLTAARGGDRDQS